MEKGSAPQCFGGKPPCSAVVAYTRIELPTHSCAKGTSVVWGYENCTIQPLQCHDRVGAVARITRKWHLDIVPHMSFSSARYGIFFPDGSYRNRHTSSSFEYLTLETASAYSPLPIGVELYSKCDSATKATVLAGGNGHSASAVPRRIGSVNDWLSF